MTLPFTDFMRVPLFADNKPCAEFWIRFAKVYRHFTLDEINTLSIDEYNRLRNEARIKMLSGANQSLQLTPCVYLTICLVGLMMQS